MGGSSKTDEHYNTYNTGLGDKQYEKLKGNQNSLNDSLFGTSGKDGKDGAFKKVNTNINDAHSGLKGNIKDFRKSMDAQLGAQNTTRDKQYKTLNDGQAAIDAQGLSNQTGIGDLQTTANTIDTNVNDGFTDMNTRFDTVDTATSGLQTSVDNGFTDQAQGFADAQTAMANNAANAEGLLNTGFSETGQAMADNSALTQQNIAMSQANVLGGQSGLMSDLNTMSNTNDIYFDALSQGQTGLNQQNQEYATNFDNYVDRYKDDTAQSNSAMNDMQLAQNNGFNRVNDTIGTTTQASDLANSQGQRDLMLQANNNMGMMSNGLASPPQYAQMPASGQLTQPMQQPMQYQPMQQPMQQPYTQTGNVPPRQV